MGGSAGGLLMGAILNMSKNLFNGVIANVPFVDVVNTMLDDTIPLTTGEYDEWGNPNIEFSENRMVVKFRDKFKFRRGRLNCSLNDEGKWRWFGIQFIIKED